MKILIVEDSYNIRKNLIKFISEIKGFVVSGEAEDSQSAIKLINETNPEIIILDIDLKNSNGFEVLKYVKSTEYNFNPVVIVFSNYIKLYKDKVKQIDADYFFDKTNEVDKLISTLFELSANKYQ